MSENDTWESTFRVRMAEAHERFARAGSDGARRDPDRALLQAMVRYLVRSLFERAVANCRSNLRQQLVWQRRMIGALAEIVNRPIYRGRYRSPTEDVLAAAGVRPLVLPTTFDRPAMFIDTSRYGHAAEDQTAPSGFGRVNTLEQKFVLEACQAYNKALNRTGERATVSVLSFYLAQAQALERELDGCNLPMFDGLTVDVIDRIQGQQADIVMISFVRARKGGAIGPGFGTWLQDVRRLNVACTRARRALVLVGHADTLGRLGTTRAGRPRDQQAEPAVSFYANLFDLFRSSPEYKRVHRL
jgi:superfamily I DNA and/or RNA helicase